MKKFEWDEKKNTRNAEKHGLCFEDVEQLFDDQFISRIDNRKTYGEVRHIALGRVRDIPVCVVYTTRGDKIRIISARRANYEEKAKIKNRLG